MTLRGQYHTTHDHDEEAEQVLNEQPDRHVRDFYIDKCERARSARERDKLNNIQ